MVNLFFHYFLIKAIPHLRSLVIGPEALNSFDGTCIISYEDGTLQEVTFKKGIIKKEVKTTFPDGTYQIFETKNGKPCKKIFTYSKNGTLLDLDWFDHCRSVKELNASAVSLDYEH